LKRLFGSTERYPILGLPSIRRAHVSIHFSTSTCCLTSIPDVEFSSDFAATFCYFTIGFFLWCLFRALPTVSDKLISLAASVSQVRRVSLHVIRELVSWFRFSLEMQ
jgi:hypothetical protein